MLTLGFCKFISVASVVDMIDAPSHETAVKLRRHEVNGYSRTTYC